MTHPSHGGGEVEHLLDVSEVISRNGPEECLDLFDREEADVGIDAGDLWLLRLLDRVVDSPALADREVEDRVEDPERQAA